jgi:hypothetical protein
VLIGPSVEISDIEKKRGAVVGLDYGQPAVSN